MSLETRTFEVLRISITSHCALACSYCAPSDSSPEESHFHYLSPDLLNEKLEALKQQIQIKEVHITGGEPTLHRSLFDIIDCIRSHGIHNIALTSHGFFAEPLIDSMERAGLSRMNFSLDSLDPEGLARISGRNLRIETLLANIERARQNLKVKINTTVLRGYNEDQILPLLHWAGSRKLPIRFLELMKMGPLNGSHDALFVSAEEIRQSIASKHSFQPDHTPGDSTANYFRTAEGYRFGTIANHSEPFCEGCNRLRMDALGNVYGCLSDPRFYSLPNDPEGVAHALEKAMSTKKSRFTGSPLSMQYIGG